MWSHWLLTFIKLKKPLHYMPPLNAIKKLKSFKSLIRENIAGAVNIGYVGISKAEWERSFYCLVASYRKDFLTMMLFVGETWHYKRRFSLHLRKDFYLEKLNWSWLPWPLVSCHIRRLWLSSPKWKELPVEDSFIDFRRFSIL